jgi:putative transposase
LFFRPSKILTISSLRDFDGWQDGYGAFSISHRDKDQLINYIKNQEEHHKKENFYDEYKRLIEEHGIESDPKYLL